VFRRRNWLTISLAASVSLAALLAAVGAGAEPTAFPGRNGTILAGGGAKGKLYSISADGRRRTVIHGIRTKGEGSAAWSPDGTRLAFARYGGGISIADASSRHPIRVTARGLQPAWSPDGSQLVFTQGNSLYLVRADGRGLQRLFAGWNAQWSPDGSSIAFQLHDEGSGGGDSVYVSALDGSQRLRLAAGVARACGPSPGLTHNQEPAWAPDGSRIAYSIWVFCGNNAYASISAISPDGSQHWDLVEPQGYPGGASAPVWSPDGRALAYFESYDDGGASDGMSVLTLGGKARKVARNWIPFDWRPVCRLRGGSRADRLQGGDRAELVCGLGGNDAITGGAGRDRLFGEGGADRIFAQDGEFDVVGCGAGRDTVDADTGDLVGLDCERVSRR
jgi:RTX calcium-binding nonapeptide repeat (4 copies)/WD40-like Beta Propeller Repeat